LLLQPTGLAVLDQLALAEKAIETGAKIDRIFGKAGRRVVLDVHYSALGRGFPCAVGIHRSSLFDLLYSAVRTQGIEIRTGRTIAGSRIAGSKRWISFATVADEGPFDLVVDALGTRSALAPPVGRQLAYGALWANVDWLTERFERTALSQRYREASKMAGVLPIGTCSRSDKMQAAFFWSLRSRDLPNWRSSGLDRWKDDVLELWPEATDFIGQIKSFDDLTFAAYSHRTLKNPMEQRLLHIGDSWHSASPQLGQGANMALLDAFSLAKALSEAPGVDEGLEQAVSYRRFHVRLYQLLTAVLTPVYQSDSHWIPAIRDHVMGPVSKVWPVTWLQAALVSGMVGRPVDHLGIGFAHAETRR